MAFEALPQFFGSSIWGVLKFKGKDTKASPKTAYFFAATTNSI
jgi:hypothetical protein